MMDLQTKDHPTLPMVVPCVWYLKDELKAGTMDSSILCFLKNKCRTILESKLELKDIHFAAAMLNPNYRTMRQATREEQIQGQKYLRKRVGSIAQVATSSAPTDSNSDDDNENRDYLAKYIDNPPVSRKQDEVSRYLRFEHFEANKSNVLEFWNKMTDSFPCLCKVAFQILAIPATSASVERSFSAAGQVVSERRSNISPDVVNDIVFLRSIEKNK